MTLLYKPFALIAGLIAGRIGRSVFRRLWARIDDAAPPEPSSGQGTMIKAVSAQALQAGVMAGVAAMVDRLFARGFHHLVGVWPRKQPEPDAQG
jgi:hypothetical protein